MTLTFEEDMFTRVERIVYNPGVAVFTLSYTSDHGPGGWPFSLRGVPSDPSREYQLLQGGFSDRVSDPVDLNVVNPISATMRKIGKVWDVPPDEATDKVLIFFNVPLLTKERKYSFSVTAPKSVPASDTTLYWIWSSFVFSSFEDNLAHPFTTGDGHGNTVTIPKSFETEAERTAFLSVGFIPPFATTERPFHKDAFTITWEMKVATYRKLDFPLRGLATPAWDYQPITQVIKTASGETTRSRITFTVTKKLEVSASKVAIAD